ncbi:MAG: tape measure protein [Bdellovibrionales bacterium]|nr:tape measure protein [Bdellovibrionales bacterium]
MALNVGTLYAALKLQKGDFDSQVQGSGNMLKGSIGGAAAVAGAAGVAAFAAIAAGAAKATQVGIAMNAQLETQTVAWKTLTGSAEGASKMVQDLGKFAAKTPFSQLGLDSMAKYLYNADLRGDELFGTLTKFGDIGGAFGLAEDSIVEMVRQFGQMKNAGVAYTEDLNVFEDRGIPIMKALAKEHGVTTAEIKKMAGEGKLSYEMVQGAVDNMASGMKGSMEAQSKTFSGLMSTLADNASMLAAELAKPMFDRMKSGIEFLIVNMDRVKPVIQAVQAAFSSFAAAAMNFLTPIATQVKTFLQSFSGASAAGNAFNGLKIAVSALQPVFQMVFPFIKSIVQDAVSFIGSLLAQLTAFWNANGQQIIAATRIVWGLISTVIQAALKVLLPIIMSIWGNIKGVIQGAMNIILGIIKTVTSLITGDWRGAWEGVKQIVSGAVQFIWNAVQLYFVGKLLAGIKGAVLGMRASITAGFNAARTSAVNAVNALRTGVTNGFNSLRSMIGNVNSSIRNMMVYGWNAIRGAVQAAVTSIHSAIVSRFNVIRSVVTAVMNGIRSIITTAWNSARNVVSTAVNGIRSVVQSVFNSLRSVVSSSMSGVTSAIRSGWNNARSFLTSINLVSVGKNIVQGLINGIGSMMTAVSDKISEVASSITGGIKKRMGIKSPSRVTTKLGVYIGEGLRNGIQKSGAAAAKMAVKVADNVKAQMTKLTTTKNKAQQQEIRNSITNYKAMEKAYKNHATKATAMAEQLKKNEQKIMSEYTKARSERVKEIAGANDLFSVVEQKNFNPKTFIDALRSQNDAIKIYTSSLENLKRRGLSAAMLAELQAKGVGAASEIQALTQLSDYQLRVYKSLYNERDKLAKKQTSKEMAAQREKLNKQIQAERKAAGIKARDLAKETSKAVGKTVNIAGVNAKGAAYSTIDTTGRKTSGVTYNHTTVVNSPRELNAREVAKQDRRASRNMALELGLI